MHNSIYTQSTDELVRQTLALILAGGSGTRLKSLTKWHSKPAVPFGGKYRTIDFPLSNCINSNIRKINILTQYKSHSLNTHIQNGWNFLRSELGEFINLIPAQQRLKDSWYQGTADAVHQNLDIFVSDNTRYLLVLAGDHIYKMDYRPMIQQHVMNNADITVGCLEVDYEEAKSFGVMSTNDQGRITRFTEKPPHPETIPGKPDKALASMGIYVFSKDFLVDRLEVDALNDTSDHDFGKNIIPEAVDNANLFAYLYSDPVTEGMAYWRDVGTVDAYYQANIELTNVTPKLNLYDTRWPIWTYQEQQPPAKFVFNDKGRRGYAVDSLISGGCIVSGSEVNRSVLFNNVRVHSYSHIEGAVILPNAEIGRHCVLKNVIVDRDCKIPSGTVIGVDREEDERRFYVSPEGVTLVSPEMISKELTDVA